MSSNLSSNQLKFGIDQILHHIDDHPSTSTSTSTSTSRWINLCQNSIEKETNQNLIRCEYPMRLMMMIDRSSFSLSRLKEDQLNLFYSLNIHQQSRRRILRRAVFTDEQRQGLELAFKKEKYLNKNQRKTLAENLSLKDSQVKIWFQNRRMKWRNCRERSTRLTTKNDLNSKYSTSNQFIENNKNELNRIEIEMFKSSMRHLFN